MMCAKHKDLPKDEKNALRFKAKEPGGKWSDQPASAKAVKRPKKASPTKKKAKAKKAAKVASPTAKTQKKGRKTAKSSAA